MRRIAKVKVVMHFPKWDTKYYGDYSSIDVYIDGQCVTTYGDYYHDKGLDKVEGFIEGLRFFQPTFEVERVNVADWDDVGEDGEE